MRLSMTAILFLIALVGIVTGISLAIPRTFRVQMPVEMISSPSGRKLATEFADGKIVVYDRDSTFRSAVVRRFDFVDDGVKQTLRGRFIQFADESHLVIGREFQEWNPKTEEFEPLTECFVWNIVKDQVSRVETASGRGNQLLAGNQRFLVFATADKKSARLVDSLEDHLVNVIQLVAPSRDLAIDANGENLWSAEYAPRCLDNPVTVENSGNQILLLARYKTDSSKRSFFSIWREDQTLLFPTESGSILATTRWSEPYVLTIVREQKPPEDKNYFPFERLVGHKNGTHVALQGRGGGISVSNIETGKYSTPLYFDNSNDVKYCFGESPDQLYCLPQENNHGIEIWNIREGKMVGRVGDLTNRNAIVGFTIGIGFWLVVAGVVIRRRWRQKRHPKSEGATDSVAADDETIDDIFADD